MRTQYPDIPWRKMAGMRDRLIHAYANVNLKYVWDLAVHDSPPLYTQRCALRTALD
nr:HepT-like ribonuclease domain-containing protein [Methanocorpusculum labreanum]